MAMSEEQVRGALEYYTKKWPDIAPKRLGEEDRQDGDATGMHIDSILGHVKWMAVTSLEHLDNGQAGKANRWLGFLQGVLWTSGFGGIEDARIINKTGGKPEEYKGESE